MSSNRTTPKLKALVSQKHYLNTTLLIQSMHATIISKPLQAPTSTYLKKKLLSLEEITK